VSKNDAEKVGVGRSFALVVVAGLKVAIRSIEVESVQLLVGAIVDANGKLVLLISNFVVEPLTLGDLGEYTGSGLVASATLLNTDGELALGVIVEFHDWLGGDGVVDVNLAHDDLIVILVDDEISVEAVASIEGAPFAGVGLPQLCAAVLAVGSGNTLGLGRDLHGKSSILAIGEEIVKVLKAVASLEIGAGDGLGFPRASDRQLQLPVGEVKVSTRGAFGVECSNLREVDDVERRGQKASRENLNKTGSHVEVVVSEG
jgi:hypothetical protein